MKATGIVLMNIAILSGIVSALNLGSGFHRINMRRRYAAMVHSGCINTNDLGKLERETGWKGMANAHDEVVPEWMASINAPMRLGMLASGAGLTLNLVVLIVNLRKRKRAEQSGPPNHRSPSAPVVGGR